MLQNFFGSGRALVTSCCLCLTLLNACSGQTMSEVTTATSQSFSRYEELARNKVAAQINADVAETSIISSQEVQFSDSSMNCPQPGMMYAQVVSDGYQVMVLAREQTYDVRVTGDYALICTAPGNAPRAKRRIIR